MGRRQRKESIETNVETEENQSIEEEPFKLTFTKAIKAYNLHIRYNPPLEKELRM